MRVLSLDCDLDLPDADLYPFGSSLSLFDYDVVMWSPSRSMQRYKTYAHTYNGLPSLSQTQSPALRRDVTRRRHEFAEFLRLGRVLVVFVPGETAVYIDTGKRQYSGTGRNRASTTIVEEFDIMSAVPMTLVRSPGSGLEIDAASDLFAGLLRRTRDSWVYRSILESLPTLKPLAYVRGTKKLVGGLVKMKDGDGLLLLLPDLMLDADDRDEDEDEDEELSDELGSEAGAVEGLAGGSERAGDEQSIGQALLDWIASLTGGREEPAPDWAGRLVFPTEVQLLQQREALETDLEKILVEVDEVKLALEQEALWKTLIYGSGDALEHQVRRAFELFGFNIEESSPGRSDLRVTRGDARAVVEVKGLSKSAAERHAAQLEKWVSEEVVEGRTAKGILIVNTWREVPLSARTELSFPSQMLPYSEQRNHCLVTGVQLLAMARACLDDPARADEIARTLLDTTGMVSGWDDALTMFAAVNAEVAESEPRALGSGDDVEAEAADDTSLDSTEAEATERGTRSESD